MKVLALSDLNWDQASKNINLSSVIGMTPYDILNHDFFDKAKFYFNIVVKNQPHLLLLCGDITGDGFCGHGHISSLLAFLKLVESKKIQVRYISGNHDEFQYYDEIKKQLANSMYIKELNNKPETIGDIKVIGLSWEQTRTITSLRKLFTPEKIDIVACHCDHNKRLYLFDYNTDFIITGHYDLKVINPNHKTFISFDNDGPTMATYITIDISTKKREILFNTLDCNTNKWTYFKFHKTAESFTLKESNYIYPQLLAKGVGANQVEYSQSQSKFSTLNHYAYLDNHALTKVIEMVQEKNSQGQKLSLNELAEISKVKVNHYQTVSKSFLSSYIKIE